MSAKRSAATNLLLKRWMNMPAIQNRLDKNRNLLPPLRYEIVKPHRIDQAKELLYKTYHPTELLTKHLGLCTGPNSIPDLDRVLEKCIPENLSLFALDMDDNVMGVCINRLTTRQDWTRGIDEIERKFDDPRARPLGVIRQEACLKGLHVFDDMGSETLFAINMVATHPNLIGLGMSTDIVRRSILLAGCLGYEGIQAYGSSEYVKKTLMTIGFTPVVEILYKNFQYNGEKVFDGIKNEGSMVLFQKKFFQTCLKHIV